MKLAVAFAVAVVFMLLVVAAGDQMVGIYPPTPEVTGADRVRHLRLVGAALALVISVDAAFIWLALRRPPGSETDSEYGVE